MSTTPHLRPGLEASGPERPDGLVDFRTPRFDLDSLYGRGPAQSPYLYEWLDSDFRGVKLLAGRNPFTDPVDGEELDPQDLPRNEQGRALIGDPRNDENIIVGQLQLAFIKFHDRLVDRVKSKLRLSGAALFEETRRLVTWHYQWVVVHDFLRRIAGADVVDEILRTDAAGNPSVALKFFSWQKRPFMPVEFSVAAYRFAHSMVRPDYDLKDGHRRADLRRQGQAAAPGSPQRLPAPAEPVDIDWSRFVSIEGSGPQPSRRIDIRLAPPLMKLPGLKIPTATRSRS